MGSNLLKVDSTEGMKVGDREEVRATQGNFFTHIAGFGPIVLQQGVPFSLNQGTGNFVSDPGYAIVPPIFGMGRGQEAEGADRPGAATLGTSAAPSPVNEEGHHY